MNFISHCNIALPRSLLSARTIGDFSFVKAPLRVDGGREEREERERDFFPRQRRRRSGVSFDGIVPKEKERKDWPRLLSWTVPWSKTYARHLYL